jgi:homoisocitrate dehydrogenase
MAHRIAVMPGDGIGLEVVPWAQRALQATDVAWEFVEAAAGWACFQERGVALPEETVEILGDCDAGLFGAVSSPSHKVEGYRSPIVAMRRRFNLYANLRPVISAPIATSRPNIDMMIVRENTEGLYIQRERSDGETAVAERVITRAASERIARKACELATARRQHLTIVHKANVLPETCGLFRTSARAVAEGYPTLEVDEVLVDTMALRLILSPESYDVVVSTNLFGDILSDEAAALVGGLGLTPAGNVGDELGVFEPVHGSAPDIAGQGIANPVAAILSAGMLLDYLSYGEWGDRIRASVRRALAAGQTTPDLGGDMTTGQVGNTIINGI